MTAPNQSGQTSLHDRSLHTVWAGARYHGSMWVMATRGTAVFKSVDDLERRISEYFKGLEYEKTETATHNGQEISYTTKSMRPPTTTGLALALDVSRRTLFNYSKKDEFSPVLARAKNRIAGWNEEALYNRETYRGARFNLVANFGYGKEEALDVGGTSTFFRTVYVEPSPDPDRPIPKWEPRGKDRT